MKCIKQEAVYSILYIRDLFDNNVLYFLTETIENFIIGIHVSYTFRINPMFGINSKPIHQLKCLFTILIHCTNAGSVGCLPIVVFFFFWFLLVTLLTSK